MDEAEAVAFDSYPTMVGFLHEWAIATHFPTAWPTEARAAVIAEVASLSPGCKKALAPLAFGWMAALAEPLAPHPNHATITGLAAAMLG